jgi:hypothetical protein
MRRLVPALGFLAATVAVAEPGDRHGFDLYLDQVWADADSTLGAWPEGGFGKLRYSAKGDLRNSTRIAFDYRGQVGDTLFAHVTLDYIDDAGEPIGATEAWLEWRPLPTGPTRHRYRFGAFYPSFSLENTDPGWESPYTQSFASINSWIGEEIRTIGAEWRLARALTAGGSPHEIGASAGLFYGNDPAGTLLFWRGWSAHDRQTRLNEHLPLPPLVLPNPFGGPDWIVERTIDPIAEIDDEPGIQLGAEWSYAERVKLTLGFWDNRGDPYAFRDGQWAWGTRFWHFGAQVSLPGDVGLVAQKQRGDTDWLTYTTDTGATMPGLTALVTDEFDASFVLLTKTLGDRHRVSLRRDDFYVWRPGDITSDEGYATTLAWSLAIGSRIETRVEWLEIESTRDLWPILYGQSGDSAEEELLQLGVRLVLFGSGD